MADSAYPPAGSERPVTRHCCVKVNGSKGSISLLRGVYEVLHTQILEFRTKCGVLSTKPEYAVLNAQNFAQYPGAYAPLHGWVAG